MTYILGIPSKLCAAVLIRVKRHFVFFISLVHQISPLINQISPLMHLSQLLSLCCWVSIKIQNKLFYLTLTCYSPSSKEIREGTKRQELNSAVIWFFISFKNIYCSFAFRYVCKELQEVTSHLTWALETKLWSSRRTSCNLSTQATSPDCFSFFSRGSFFSNDSRLLHDDKNTYQPMQWPYVHC